MCLVDYLCFCCFGIFVRRCASLTTLGFVFIGIFVRKCTVESVSEPAEYNILFTIEMERDIHIDALC